VELLTLDPASWEAYAQDQLYQKAEDRLVAAQEAEVCSLTNVFFY
jgi:hypothetical protein